jgi:GSH-dependent disulfide-bond oxidoreductase
LPIDVYLWATPNSWKVTIALEEMQLPYVAKPVAIGRGEQFRPDFLTISPNNRIPAIVDPDGPDGQRISVFESGAILQYLGRKAEKFYPADERARTEVEQWLFWQMGGLGPMYGQASHFLIYAPTLVEDQTKIDYSARRYSNEVSRLLGVLNRRLENRAFVAGDYSIADMATYPWVTMSGMLGEDLAAFPHVQAWVDRMAARPAVQKGMGSTAHLGAPPPRRGTEEHRIFAQSLFGQTDASVREAAAERAEIDGLKR